MGSYSVSINCMIEVAGRVQDISLGLSGMVDRDGRAYDLCWDESWVSRYFDPDLFYEDFMQSVRASQIDQAYEEYRDREAFRCDSQT